MKEMTKALGVVMAAALLAGCSDNDTTSQTYSSFADIDADATAMQAKYTDANGDLLSSVTRAQPSDNPDTGSATYTGFVGGDVAGADLVGQLTVDADFAAGTLNSSATDFHHETQGAYSGSLSGTGVLLQTPPMGVPQVSANLDGTLSNGGTDFATSIAIEGDIVNDGTDAAGAMAGLADGTVGSDMFTGTFAAEN